MDICAGQSLSFSGFRWNINPGSRAIALQRGVENRELPQSVDELRILGRLAERRDRGVEAPKDLLEGVVVAFAVAAGKIGIAASGGLEQGRILDEHLIAYIAMACPKFVGSLLIPCNGRSSSVDLNAQPILSARGDLAGSHAAACAHSHTEYHGTEVFCIDGRFDVIFRSEQLIGKSFDRVLGLFARGVKRLKISAKRGHTQSGHMFRHIKKV